MNTILKGAAIVALTAMGASLSACGSESANANATPSQDAADLTAASLDQEMAANPAPPPTEAASAAAPAASEAASH